MHNLFKAISLSYKNAPLEVREQVALNPELSQALLLSLKSLSDISDILVISTCNRTEVYYSSSVDYSQTIIHKLLKIKHLSNESAYFPYFQIINDHAPAVQRLFEVAIGLESQVVGDIQIINQIKQAYQMAADLDTVGPFLHRLLHTIFFTNKKVVQETAFRSGAASASYATVELIEELALGINEPQILVIGVGEIGTDVCRNLGASQLKNINITNRTFEKALALAHECGANALPFEQVWSAIAEADIIVSSVATAEPFIQKEFIQSLNIQSFKYFIDLSVPRSIEAEIEEKSGVLLYNIDQINNKVSEALQQRLAAIAEVKAIIQASLLEFNEWSKEMEISPTIQKLKNALEQIRQEELARYMKKLSEDEAYRLDQVTKSMMQKIIKLPTLQLKAACKRGEAETLIDVLNDLFNLEKQKV
ncbi:MAG: glutamyl-tRNA reductase [Microscillaceae bacterium]|jgi:glutamyl-tRNA reductase|nr:glutamyl-tRNA reductase [Microscillaceae bacterium]